MNCYGRSASSVEGRLVHDPEPLAIPGTIAKREQVTRDVNDFLIHCEAGIICPVVTDS